MTQAGKGSKRRPTDERKVSDKWEKINWSKSHVKPDSDKKVKINENNS
jgi:hypothetical protein